MAGYLPDSFYTIFEELDEHPWIFAAMASVLVGLSGILPLLIIPIDSTASFKDGRKSMFTIFRLSSHFFTHMRSFVLYNL